MMEILFLGTAAAEGWPGIFCECPCCTKARLLKGKDIRTRSSVLIDEIYKVDFPPDTNWQANKYRINLSEVEHLFVTHSHNDHYYPTELSFRAKPFAHPRPKKTLSIYGSEVVKNITTQALGAHKKASNISFQIIEPFVEFTAGKMTVLPLIADHDPDEICFNYIFSYEGHNVLYGHDTGWYPEDTWRVLERYKFDLLILDCTNGRIEEESYHLGVKGLIKVRDKLRETGSLNEKCKCVATHFSHNGGLLQAELENILLPEGIEVAYDGKTVII
ncbi:MAG: MBL fold metallo-hydrolase [bacterium]|jgi:phosphoribosyl 1,2-cyclic phosphate phosphodiesterase